MDEFKINIVASLSKNGEFTEHDSSDLEMKDTDVQDNDGMII
jgi:hypothetical protein